MIKAECPTSATVANSRGTRRAFLTAAGTAAAGLFSAAVTDPGRSEPSPLAGSERRLRWLAFYGTSAPESVLAAYDIVVLDPGFQGSIGQVAAAGARVCGYLSLGEIRTAGSFVDELDRAALLTENPNWQGTYRIDIRSPSWRSLILDRQIPSLIEQGFTGLMFDTLDTPSYLEQLDARHRGMRDAAIALVHSIRTRWPEMMLIMNRGYAVLPEVLGSIDALIAESFMTAPDGATDGKWVDPKQIELQLTLLKPAADRHPPLPILSLDYWAPEDTATIAEIYRRERELGHHPYVATQCLDQIVGEP